MWRRVFNAKLGRSRSSPLFEIYNPGTHGDGGAGFRVHLYTAALSALHTGMSKAMSDVHDTAQRAASRSAVALALHKWGCRSDPSKWECAHLREALELHLGQVAVMD